MEFIDEAASEYLKSLKLYSFDGKRISEATLGRRTDRYYGDGIILMDVEKSAYFIPVRLYQYGEHKKLEKRENVLEFLKKNRKIEGRVSEYLLMIGAKRFYVFAVRKPSREEVCIDVLGVIKDERFDVSVEEKLFINNMIREAFQYGFVEGKVPDLYYYGLSDEKLFLDRSAVEYLKEQLKE